MRYEFGSKVFLGRAKGNLFLRILFIIAALMISFALLIKIIVNDFAFSDMANILVILLLIGASSRRGRSKLQYAFTNCIVEFGNEQMTISYPNVNGGKNLGSFQDVYTIEYKDIENLEFGRELGCFRIVAKHTLKKTCFDLGKENVWEKEPGSEIFLYVLEEEEQETVLKAMRRYTGFLVRVIE